MKIELGLLFGTTILLVSTCCQDIAQAQQMGLSRLFGSSNPSADIMDTSQHRLLDYRRMMRNGRTPQPYELAGQWNGVNKGVVEFVGYGQFVKDIQPGEGGLVGDNIQVTQVDRGMVRGMGWEPIPDRSTGGYQRQGKFAVQPPTQRGTFGQGAFFSYRNGGNQKNDPARLLADEVVKIDENHLLGRATANFGPFRIPLSYFVLERAPGTQQTVPYMSPR